MESGLKEYFEILVIIYSDDSIIGIYNLLLFVSFLFTSPYCNSVHRDSFVAWKLGKSQLSKIQVSFLIFSKNSNKQGHSMTFISKRRIQC